MSFLQVTNLGVPDGLPQVPKQYSLLYRLRQVLTSLNFRHIIADELAFCTKCNFPCNYSYMKKLIECKNLESTCPMCNAEITINDVKLVGESGVQALKHVAKEGDDKDKEKKRDISTPMAAD